MRTIMTAAVVALTLAAAGCSKPTQEKTSQDLKAAGAKVGEAAKHVAATPEAKAVGSDLKQGAAETAAKTRQAAGKAGAKLKQAGSDIKADAQKSGRDVANATKD